MRAAIRSDSWPCLSRQLVELRRRRRRRRRTLRVLRLELLAQRRQLVLLPRVELPLLLLQGLELGLPRALLGDVLEARLAHEPVPGLQAPAQRPVHRVAADAPQEAHCRRPRDLVGRQAYVVVAVA